MKCDNCGSKLNEIYRFTDWDNEGNDSYGTLDECQKLFDEAVAEQEDKRVSIYDVSECVKCEHFLDEGIIFNEKCPDYKAN